MPDLSIINASHACLDFGEGAAVNVPAAPLCAGGQLRLRPFLLRTKALEISSDRVLWVLLQYQSLKLRGRSSICCSDIGATYSHD